MTVMCHNLFKQTTVISGISPQSQVPKIPQDLAVEFYYRMLGFPHTFEQWICSGRCGVKSHDAPDCSEWEWHGLGTQQPAFIFFLRTAKMVSVFTTAWMNNAWFNCLCFCSLWPILQVCWSWLRNHPHSIHTCFLSFQCPTSKMASTHKTVQKAISIVDHQ